MWNGDLAGVDVDCPQMVLEPPLGPNSQQFQSLVQSSSQLILACHWWSKLIMQNKYCLTAHSCRVDWFVFPFPIIFPFPSVWNHWTALLQFIFPVCQHIGSQMFFLLCLTTCLSHQLSLCGPQTVNDRSVCVHNICRSDIHSTDSFGNLQDCGAHGWGGHSMSS